MQTENEEPENEKMKILMELLISLYPDYKAKQLSNHTATVWLSNDYDLFVDVNSNPGSWTAQRKRGTLRNDLMLRGGRVPKEDVEKADELITRYNEALVSHIMEVEGREKDGIKKDIEVLKWHKKTKGQAPAQALADPAESQTEEEEKPVFSSVIDTKGGLVKINFIMEEAAPEEPNLEEIQEAPADPEGEKEVQALPGPIISPLAHQEYKSKGFDTEVPNNYSMWISEKICPKCSGYLYLQHSGFSEPLIICGKCKTSYFYIDLDRLPDRKKQEGEEIQSSQPEEEKKPYQHPLGPGFYALPCHPLDSKFKNLVSSKEAADLNTWDGITEKIIKDMDAAKLQPGEDYDEKIEAKSMEIFDSLLREIGIAQANEPESQDTYLADRLSKIYESLEVLQLLYSAQRLQYLRDFANLQSQEPAEAKQAQEAELNEVFLLKNSKGYSWKITARGMDLETAAEAVLQVNETFKLVAKGG